MVGERPLIYSGQIKEHLLFYLQRPVQEEATGRAIQILQENPDAYLLLLSEEAQGVIAAHPNFKIVLKTDAWLRRQYQLIQYIPD